MVTKLDILKEYIRDRNNILMYDYGIITDEKLLNRKMVAIRLPNTLRYLDKTSQLLIRTVNFVDLTLEEKFLTALCYTLIGNHDRIVTLSQAGVFNYSRLPNIKKTLCRFIEFEQGIATPIGLVNKPDRGNALMHCLNTLWKNITPQQLKGNKLSKVTQMLYEADTDYLIPSYLYLQLALNLAYIDELGITLDNTFGYDVPRGAMNLVLKEDKLGPMIDWYNETYGAVPFLSLLTPQDVLHCYYGMMNYTMRGHKIPYRPYKKFFTREKKDSELIVIPRCIKHYEETIQF